MKKMFIYQILSSIFICFQLYTQCFALDKETHKAINENIAKTSLNNFSLNLFLTNQLGFKGGIEEVINGKEIWKWVRDGGQYEDEPFYTRSFNHFHNPLLSWDQAGYGETFKSAVLWAEDQGTFGSLFGGNYSWKAVRDYYYLGLTSYTKTDRDKNFAETFRGLGQLMHLVTDMSVPAHSRNDGHLFYNYENWVSRNYKDYASLLLPRAVGYSAGCENMKIETELI